MRVRATRSLNQDSVLDSGQALLNDGFGVVPETPEIIGEFSRKILIQLESHLVRIGTRRSS